MLKHRITSSHPATSMLRSHFQTASRQMFERLFNAPKGFGKFYPPGSSSAGSGASTASKTATGTAKKAQPTGGGGGGGGGGKNPEPPTPEALFQISVVTGAIIFGGAYMALSSRQGEEISMQEFQSQLLEAGKVDRIIIANKTIARIVLKEGISSSPISNGGDIMAHKDDGMSADLRI